MLGDESLIHYQGLSSGMGVAPVSGGSSVGMGGGMGQPGIVTGSGAGTTVNNVGNALNNYAPGQANANATAAQPITAYAAAGQPCPAGTVPATAAGNSRLTNVANTAGAQNQAAGNAISNATSAISGLGGLFKKKNANANAAAATTANGAVPCTPVANANVNAASAVNPVANPVMPQAAGTPVTAAPGAATAAGTVANGKGAAIGRAVGATNTAVASRTAGTQPVNPQAAVAAPATAQTPAVNRTALRQPAPPKAPAAQPAAKKPAPTPAPANTTTAAGK